MNILKEKLNSLVTPDNLLDTDILKLSQELDIEIVKTMKEGQVIWKQGAY